MCGGGGTRTEGGNEQTDKQTESRKTEEVGGLQEVSEVGGGITELRVRGEKQNEPRRETDLASNTASRLTS